MINSKINIVTTAALPWYTGTAILPLMRSYYLAKRGYHTTLYLPWISIREQKILFANKVFETHEQQKQYNLQYLPGNSENLQIKFYPAKFYSSLQSILPTNPIVKFMDFCDWLILEEPEHLNWLSPFANYHAKAKRITGIVLTNYFFYAKNQNLAGYLMSGLLKKYNHFLIQRHCDDIIRPSSAIPVLPQSHCFYCNGVHPSFFTPSTDIPSKQIYFIGKLLWHKGFRELMDLLAKSTIKNIDIYGEGPDKTAIMHYAKKNNIQMCFHGLSRTPAADLRDYRIFFNPSRSEVICTTTAEALVQGRFVILPQDPSNEIFYKFKNCLCYKNPEEFLEKLNYALNNPPEIDEQISELSWEIATQKLLDYYQNTEIKEPV